MNLIITTCGQTNIDIKLWDGLDGTLLHTIFGEEKGVYQRALRCLNVSPPGLASKQSDLIMVYGDSAGMLKFYEQKGDQQKAEQQNAD